MRPIVYIAGKYSDRNPRLVKENIDKARQMAIQLWKEGFAVFCPHLNTENFHLLPDFQHIADDVFYTGDLVILERCDALILLDNWTESKGAKLEFDFAHKNGIPIFTDVVALKEYCKNTYFRLPNQYSSFLEIIMKWFRLHIAKNTDYSPYNIKGTGMVGLTTRIWDKCARLMNLIGFDIGTGEYNKPREPKNESIEDTLTDNGIYSIIGLIYRKGKWGS